LGAVECRIRRECRAQRAQGTRTCCSRTNAGSLFVPTNSGPAAATR
jgi:hypothetical protein